MRWSTDDGWDLRCQPQRACRLASMPEGRKGNEAKLFQKDMDSRWGKNINEFLHCYKAHTNVDVINKSTCTLVVTAASVHDSQVFGSLYKRVPTWTQCLRRQGLHLG